LRNLNTKSSFVIPVILSGGSGTRLWPLSRSASPKQFLTLIEDGAKQTLFQQAATRINAIDNSQITLGPTLIVTNEEHRFLVLDQLRELKDIDVRLLLEPVGRNTAPALSLAAMCATEIEGYDDKSCSSRDDPILVIAPADQAIQDQLAFVKSVQDCIAVVEADLSKKTIALLGISPTTPEIGYGYIQRTVTKGKNNEFLVTQFTEKPDIETARFYVNDGNYLWNSGIFVMYASTWLNALRHYRPDIAKLTQLAWQTKIFDRLQESTFIRTDKTLFAQIPSESIDYAVLEKCCVAADTCNSLNKTSEQPKESFILKMIELNAGWSDVGSWKAVWETSKKDSNGNVIKGDVLSINTNNSLVYSNSRLVSTLGVENLIVVETPDAVLIANRSDSQAIKSIVTHLSEKEREEKNIHRKVLRPWGWYDSIGLGERFKVKHILVHPGASLSLQMHHHRAEHWVVVKGLAEVQNGVKKTKLKENESIYIPKGQIHRLSNPGNEPLEIIEIQSGLYLGEDDIVRFIDNYGRE
jgi:mannose-1-phosphate guanylyltransferase/mannose-6-phosphate isomerase